MACHLALPTEVGRCIPLHQGFIQSGVAVEGLLNVVEGYGALLRVACGLVVCCGETGWCVALCLCLCFAIRRTPYSVVWPASDHESWWHRRRQPLCLEPSPHLATQKTIRHSYLFVGECWVIPAWGWCGVMSCGVVSCGVGCGIWRGV